MDALQARRELPNGELEDGSQRQEAPDRPLEHVEGELELDSRKRELPAVLLSVRFLTLGHVQLQKRRIHEVCYADGEAGTERDVERHCHVSAALIHARLVVLKGHHARKARQSRRGHQPEDVAEEVGEIVPIAAFL